MSIYKDRTDRMFLFGLYSSDQVGVSLLDLVFLVKNRSISSGNGALWIFRIILHL